MPFMFGQPNATPAAAPGKTASKAKPKAGKKKAAPKFKALPPQNKTAMRADALAGC